MPFASTYHVGTKNKVYFSLILIFGLGLLAAFYSSDQKDLSSQIYSDQEQDVHKALKLFVRHFPNRTNFLVDDYRLIQEGCSRADKLYSNILEEEDLETPPGTFVFEPITLEKARLLRQQDLAKRGLISKINYHQNRVDKALPGSWQLSIVGFLYSRQLNLSEPTRLRSNIIAYIENIKTAVNSYDFESCISLVSPIITTMESVERSAQ